MALDIDAIKQLIKIQKHKSTISKAIKHQNRIKFHAQTRVTADLCQPNIDFLAFVRNLIPSDKFKIFQTLFRYPVATNEIADVCFNKLSRVFDGRNPAYNYQFMTSEQADDWEDYRQTVLGEPDVWSNKGWEFFKTEINSVLVVDLAQEQVGQYPEPYFYFVTIDNVIDYDIDHETGNMEYIIFRTCDGIVVIDDESYRLFSVDSSHNIQYLMVNNNHDLGYCPARFFWDENINIKDPGLKKSPLTDKLSDLDWYLFYHISKRHLDLYGSYPIYSGYEQSCDYENDKGDHCDNGLIKGKDDKYVYDPYGNPMRCPVCGDKRFTGAGSYIEIPVPDGDQQPDMRNPIQILTVDKDSLDYNVSEDDRLRSSIITSICGTAADPQAKQAINEKQVQSTFEDQTTILNRVKKGFESAQQFVDETVCRLRYGNLFISAKVNYGTEFYLYDVSELRNRYKTAQDSGASEAELDALQKQIIATEYRNNPIQLQRMLILSDLEPYRHSTRQEVVDLHDKGIINDNDLQIKLNFSNFVSRFERENTNVLEFANQIPYADKISLIYNKFKDYASENRIGER